MRAQRCRNGRITDPGSPDLVASGQVDVDLCIGPHVIVKRSFGMTGGEGDDISG